MRLIVLVISLAFLIALALAGGGFWAVQKIYEPGPLPDKRLVLIERGWGVQRIAATLEKEHVISHALLFRIAARLRNGESALKAGEYEFAPRLSIAEVFAKIAAGDVYPRRVTVPEGLTVRQILALLETTPALSGTVTAPPPEGSLLPETYAYVYGDTRQSLVDQMQAAMKTVLAELWARRTADLPVATSQEAVTLASIVEKETGIGAERPRIAGVFVNRLRLGMKLQSDPTVLYALTGGAPETEGMGPIGRRLLTRDLGFDSPYNTYLYAGLPPGPIANPGRHALEAALNPERNDFVYFVADGTGGHVFARTLEEHNQNVVRWRTLRRNSADTP